MVGSYIEPGTPHPCGPIGSRGPHADKYTEDGNDPRAVPPTRKRRAVCDAEGSPQEAGRTPATQNTPRHRLNFFYSIRFWRIFMVLRFNKLIVASAVAAAIAGSSGAFAAGTPSQEIVEARQESQIWTTYALSPYLRANDLKVSVHSGKATLTGNVAEGVNKDLAKQIALGVDGIKSVDNKIEVVPDYKMPAQPADRSYGEVVDDASITSAVKSKMLWSRYADGLTANVDTTRGKVKLSGTAETQEAKDAAGKLAGNTRGVNSVSNQLVVGSGKPGAAKSEGTDIADGWITTKVKSTFMYSSNVDGSDISVDTKGGIVTLTGKMDSGAERALAIELAGNVRGVKSVDSKLLTM
jgi:hyperosmotically inducible protein